MKGIDVSKWNETVDYGQVKKSGIDFVMIRSSYGDGTNRFKEKGRDPLFERNYEGAKSQGLFVGVYHYSYATNLEEAHREAEFFLKTIRGKSFEYPVVIDIEDEKLQSSLKGKKLTGIAEASLRAIEEAGYYAMLYSSKHWLENYMDSKALKRYDTWVAQWSSALTYTGAWGIWQYSSKGKVSGISGNVDLNYSRKDYPSIMAQKGLNNHKAKPQETSSKKGIVVYSANADHRSAELLADKLRYPTYDVGRGEEGLKDFEDILYLGPTAFKPERASRHIQGKDRYETAQKVLDYIKDLSL